MSAMINKVLKSKVFKGASETAVRMMLHHPWMMVLYYSVGIYEVEPPMTTIVRTLCTNGVSMWVNPEFWQQLTKNQRVTAIAHELGHKMLMHTTRRASREPHIWNIAGDHVINLMLTESGFQPLTNMTIDGLPWTWCCEARFKGMTTEAVYDILAQEYKEKEDAQGQGDSGEGDDDSDSGEGETEGKPVAGGCRRGKGRTAGEIAEEDLGAGKDIVDFGQAPDGTQDEGDGRSKESMEAFEQRIRKELKEAETTAQMAGNAPAWMERVIGQAEKSKVKWYQVLEEFLSSMHRADYSWRRFSKREFVKLGILSPDMYEPAMGGVAVFVDCSGSIGGPTMDQFNAQFQAIVEQVRPAWVEVRYFETEVNHDLDQRFERGEVEVELKPGGGVGTSFAWLDHEIDEMEEKPDVAIMLTDMYGPFGHEPSVPVFWVSVSAIDTAPFGEVVNV